MEVVPWKNPLRYGKHMRRVQSCRIIGLIGTFNKFEREKKSYARNLQFEVMISGRIYHYFAIHTEF